MREWLSGGKWSGEKTGGDTTQLLPSGWERLCSRVLRFTMPSSVDSILVGREPPLAIEDKPCHANTRCNAVGERIVHYRSRAQTVEIWLIFFEPFAELVEEGEPAGVGGGGPPVCRDPDSGLHPGQDGSNKVSEREEVGVSQWQHAGIPQRVDRGTPPPNIIFR